MSIIKASYCCLALLTLLCPFASIGAQAQESAPEDPALVALPVVVTDRDGLSLKTLKREDFQIFEDGKRQEISYFANSTEPFKLALMIDTSGSSEEKLAHISGMAAAFLDLLRPSDLVRLVSFDSDILESGDFTADRDKVRKALKDLHPAGGTRLYDALQRALTYFQQVKGRKAIVLVTDGVDFKSTDFEADENYRLLEEAGVVLFAVKINSRRETEARIRQQQQADSSVVFTQVVKGVPTGTTPTTVPGDTQVPTLKRTPVTDRIGIPPDQQGRPPGGRRNPGDQGDRPVPQGRFPAPTSTRTVPDEPGEGPGPFLDKIYKDAEQYLSELAMRSGGQVLPIDDISQLPVTFNAVSSDLRAQYTLGYISSNQMRTGRYRRIVIKVSAADATVRTRPGFREGKD